jgi:OPT family oligopeptide transporter
LAVTFVLPVGLIQALTNQQPGLNIITEYVVGYLLPGRPIANVVFKTQGYISMSQALALVSDLKLGHYMKIPPRSMFWAQLIGTFVAGIVNQVTANWLMSDRPNICNKKLDPAFGCPFSQTFFSASVIWGLVSPNRMFGPSSIYNPINYFFLIGLLLPIPFYFLKKKFTGTWVEYIHIPVILSSTGMMPPARPYHYFNWLVLGVIFQFYVRRYHSSWHLRFTYVLSAALDSGVAFFGLLSFLIFGLRDVGAPVWWGNAVDGNCPLAGSPTIAPVGSQ